MDDTQADRVPEEDAERADTLEYDEDFYGWAQQQAAVVRAEHWHALDATNLAAAFESLTEGGDRELRHRLQEEAFDAWARRTADLLRRQQWDAIEWEAVIEVLESMPRGSRWELRHRLRHLLLHLLMWASQPDYRRTGHSWRDNIRAQRARLALLLADNPALHQEGAPVLQQIYTNAVDEAMTQTHLPREAFPAACPWTFAQVLEETFWPEET